LTIVTGAARVAGMGTTFSPLFDAAVAAPTCESCGRTPARAITVRRHVGLLVLQQFVTVRVTACRLCGRSLVRRFTARTLWQGWWGLISFFFNWFVLAANALTWRRLGSLVSPSLSGQLVTDTPTDFRDVERASQSKRRSRLRTLGAALFVGLVLLGLASRGWDATHHDHAGETHGAPAPVDLIRSEMTKGAFTAADGSAVQVSQASCAGDGEATSTAFTHFRCDVTFADGTSDAVVVHLLEDDRLFFMSAHG
jgi:hypothetical protein